MRKVRLVLALILAAVALVVVVQNTEVVTFHFLAWEASMSLILLLPLVLLVGFLLGFLVAKLTGRRAAAKAA